MTRIKKAQRSINRHLLVLCLALPGVASCQQAPKPNPSPKHVVKITGRIPLSLEVKMQASYGVSDGKNECKPTTIGDNFAAQFVSQYAKTQLLNVKRNGDKYETNVVLDEYLPGKCGWEFGAVSVEVMKDKKSDQDHTYVLTQPVIVYSEEEIKSSCGFAVDDSCPEVKNSDDTPVIIRCAMISYGAEGDRNGMLCQGSTKTRYKKTQVALPSTNHVVIDFYDLSVEPDPIEGK